MLNRADIVYTYDGSFEGLLSCVYESMQQQEEPAQISPDDQPLSLLYRQKSVATSAERANMIDKAIVQKISREAQQLVRLCFMNCAEDKEIIIYDFLRLGFEKGGRVVSNFADEKVSRIHRAVKYLTSEAHNLMGFARFSEYENVLLSVIEPKNFVLPLLQPHFCDRFSGERFMIYDKTHSAALIYQPGSWKIVRMEDVSAFSPTSDELEYRKLWKQFYDTIAIKERINPKCQMSHMPKWYWKHMTEHQQQATPRDGYLHA